MNWIDALSLAEITQRLNSRRQIDFRELLPRYSGKLTESAVLMLLIQEENHWQLLLTRRNNHLKHHQGQVAFPGGAQEPVDRSFEDTALRETREEISLEPERVRMISSFSPLDTITRFRVHPFIGTCDWPQPLVANPQEVERIFLMPLVWLAEDSHWKYQDFTVPDTNLHRNTISYEPYDGEVLWGFSAVLTHMLIQALKQQP